MVDNSFACFMRSHWGELHRQAYRRCGNWHDAEDLVQITLGRILDKWERIENVDKIMAYAYMTLRNVSIDHRRKLWLQREVSHADVPDPDSDDQRLFDEEILLAMLVAQLSARQRAVVVLRYWNGLTIGETAAILNCSCGAVTVHTRRACEALRVALSSGPVSTWRTGR